jgi:MFS transporter, MHS family, proline/betaine transporter
MWPIAIQNGRSACAPGHRLNKTTKIIVACSIGNALEWFDFAAYVMFATTIAKLYFPTGHELTSLLATFGTFAVGFLARPLGALVLGGYADRAGRKAALTATMLMMALGTSIIALTPTFAVIGLAAPILIVVARLVQGLSAGGEIGGAIAFLIEHAPREKRGFFAAWQQAGVAGSYILAGGSGYLITQILTTRQIEDWGWRLPFLLGLCIAPIGLYIRASLEETPVFAREQESIKESSPLNTFFRNQFRSLAIGVGIVVVWTACSYAAYYMPTYAVHELGLNNSSAFLGLFILGSVLMFVPLVGRWSDRLGRIPLMFTAAVGILVLAYPMFYLLTSHPNAGMLISVQLTIAVLLTLYTGPASAALAELFPTEVRSTGISLSYSISVTAFGGFAPMIFTALIGLTGDKLAIDYYLMGAAVISIAALWFDRSSTPVRAAKTRVQVGVGPVPESGHVEDKRIHTRSSL